MSIKSRVKEYLVSKNIKKLEFYKLVNVSNGYLDKEGAINSDVLANILTKFPELDIHWLLFGGGSIDNSTIIKPAETCGDKCILKDYIIELQKEKIHELESKLNLYLHKTYHS
jgi:hypothetical protein